MKIITKAAVALTISALATQAAQAISLSNSDAEVRVLTITENGGRVEYSLAAKATAEVCKKGCFITFPTGEIMAFKGSEKVVVEGGKGRIVSQ